MSGARTTRLAYGAVPAAVRSWVDDVLGSPVVAAAEQVGGFSPGCTTRVRCADGTCAFVKAVGRELNPDTPVLFRREVQALTLLGSHPLWADLLAARDGFDGPGDPGQDTGQDAGRDAGWIALVLEDVPGGHPDLADDTVLERLLEATDALVAVLGERVPVVPAPGPPGPAPFFRAGPVRLADTTAEWSDSLLAAAALPDPPLPAWLRRGARDWSARLDALAAEPSEHAVHHDVRVDNLLQRSDGSLVFVDWGAFGAGPPWHDLLLARLERVDDAWFDRSLASSPALADAGDERVTTWLVGMGAHLAWRAASVVPGGPGDLPGLADFRRAESARFLGAAARRTGI